MDFSNSLKFGIIFSILLLPSANAEPTVLNKQIREVYSKSVCAAAEAGSEGDEGGEEEDQETSKAQKKFDSEYQKKLENLIKLTLAKKDPNSKIRAENLEATMRFFAPVIVGSRFYTPIADNALTAKFSTTTDLEKRIAQDKNSYESNPNALKEDKSSFLEGTFYSTDDSKTSLNSEQKAQMDKLRIDLLEAVLANGSCTKFDLNAVRFTQKFFSSEDKAKEFASDPSHLESFERCEGPLERKGKGNSPPPTPIKDSEQFMDCPDLTSFFQDNQWELNPDALMAANSKTYKKSTCQEHVLTTPGCADAIERNQFLENLEREGKSRYALAQKALKECVDRLKAESGKNLKVTGVEIESSASRFRNTGIACQKTFSDLSADRANSAKSLLLGIFYDENISTTGLPVNIDSIGEWGHKIDLMKAAGAKVDKEIEKLRGTSGPKPDPENRPKFDQYKYVKIRIHYKTITPIVPLVDEQNKYTVICRGLDLASCSEDDKPNEGNGKFHFSRGYTHSGGDGSHKVHRKRKGGKKHARCDAYR